MKLAAAKALVSCSTSVLSSPQLPLGECCEKYDSVIKVAAKLTIDVVLLVAARSIHHAVFVEESVYAAAG